MGVTVLALDTESNGLDPRHDPAFKMLGVSYATHSEYGYLPFGHLGTGNITKDSAQARLQSLLNRSEVVVFHNAKYDLVSLSRTFPDIDWWGLNWYDTMLMQHFVDENVLNKGLEALGQLYFKEGKERDEDFKIFIKGPGWAFLPVWLTEKYAIQDANLTRRLYKKLHNRFTDEGFDGSLWETEKAFVEAIASMETIGICIDSELSQSEFELGQECMARIVLALGGLNPSSPKDLEELLIGRLGLPIVKPTKGTKDLPEADWKPSFDRQAMEEYEVLLQSRKDRTAQLVLEYRGWQKACSTYFKAFLEKRATDGKIHPNFKIHGTRTSRLSCEEPNLQQIPRTTSEDKRWNLNTKKCIVSEAGFALWELDYSNLELRLAAIYSGQDNLIGAFDRGDSIWEYMSSLLGGWEKNKTKTVTYATLYGAGVKKLANTMGVSDKEAGLTRDRYFQTFPDIEKTIKLVNSYAKSAGYIKLWTGRRRHFPSTESPHKAFNSLLQGGGAECVKRALIRIWIELTRKNTNPLCKLVLTVHDSILLEIKEGFEDHYVPLAKRIMEDIPTRQFGMKFTVDAHEWGS